MDLSFLAGKTGTGTAVSNVTSPSPGPNETAAESLSVGRQCDSHNATDTLYKAWYSINCITTYTVDSQIILTMYSTAALGLLSFLVFCWGQSFCSVYRGRLLSTSVAIKPPVVTSKNLFKKYFAWLWITLSMSESDLLATAGMDALMFERLLVFCIQFMFPVMVIAVSTLIPIHTSSNFLARNTSQGQQFAKTNLMFLTMGNLQPGAKTLWVHFCFVVAFTCYGMWLLDQHYKSYVLLRQTYLTRGDSVGAWLGRTPKQRPLASYGSVLMDQPTQEAITNPLWTFARVKASDSDSGTRQPPSLAASLPIAAPSAAAGNEATAATGAGASPVDTGAVLNKLVSLERGASQSQQALPQKQSSQQLAAHPLADADGSYISSAAASAAAQAAASPFACGAQQSGLPRDTHQMVQLADVMYAAEDSIAIEAGGSMVSPLPQQGSAALQATQGTAASPSGSSSAAGSRLTSRQSSARGLLTPKHVDSSSSSAQQEPEQQGRVSGRFGFLHRGDKGRTSGNNVQPVAADDPELLDSADGTVLQGVTGPIRRRGTGCAPGCTWRCVSCRSTDDDAPSVSFAVDEVTEEEERRQHKTAKRAAAKRAAELAAQQLGADVDWWQFRTRDILLDRHVVQVDMSKELGSAGQDPRRPFYWWQLAPGDTPSAAGEAESSSSGAYSGNLQPVPNTSLLFDRRSLRARRPSVRFRNTVHVADPNGALYPLHVSSYAVLVTDVPNPPVQRTRSGSSSDFDYVPGQSPFRPFADAFAGLANTLDHCLQFLCWGWPCLLSRAQLMEHAKDWSKLSFKSANSIMVQDSKDIASKLEAGALLCAPQQDSMQGGKQQQQQHHHQPSAAALRRPVNRQQLVQQTFEQLFPNDVQAVIPAKEYKAVNELLREWNRKVQVYIHIAGLLELKRERQARKHAARAKAQREPSAGGTTAAGVAAQPVAAASAEQVCIEVTSLQGGSRAEESSFASAAKSQSAAAGQTQTSSSSDKATAAAAAGASEVNGKPSSSGQAAPRPAAMARHSSRASDSGSDESDSEDELSCLAATVRRLCCCACCSVGSMQDGGHGLLPPEEEDARSRARCCGLFGRRWQEQEAPKTMGKAKSELAERRQELLDLEAKIKKEQAKVRDAPDTGNFIVMFKTPQAATLAAHSMVYPDNGEGEPFKVQPAPSPEDVLWPSLWASPADRRSVLGIVVFWYAVLYLVPTGFFAGALNAVNLTLCSGTAGGSFAWFCHSTFLQFLVTIVAPYILLIVWQNAVIPAQMYRLELRRAVAVSLSQMERRILLAYCGWELTNLFLGGVLSGSAISQVQLFFKEPEQWAQVLGAAIPQTSNFFLNYVITRAFMLNPVRLLMPHGGMWRWIGQMLFTGFTGFKHAATESYRACIIYPASIRYGREPGLVLLILLIGMAYCVAAPLITVFVFAYMVTGYIVWRYQVIYVCVRAYESGGKMWPTYFLCIEWCLGFFVAFTSSMLIFKQANIQGVLVLLLLPGLYLFNRRCRQRYRTKVNQPPLWLAHEAPRSEISPLVYTPPCMQPNAQGWFFEAGKPWVRWGVPAYNNPKKPGHDDGGCFC